LQVLGKGKLDLVVCNFAIHYMMTKVEDLARFVGACARAHCKVLFLFLDGAAIHDLFVANDV
jgi:hypothetical protein